MKKLEFKIDIAANKKKVWDTMLNPVTYKEWVDVSWPGSSFKGNWKEGEDMKFLSPGGAGTLANIAELRPYDHVLAKHIAAIGSDSTEDRTSDIAKSWIGSTESYTFSEKNGKTEVKIEISTNPAWASMFSNGWPGALKKLKEICEQ